MATRRTGKGKGIVAPTARIQLVESESRAPMIQARAGTKIEMIRIATPEGKPSRIGARLCGYGSGYCLAIVETE